MPVPGTRGRNSEAWDGHAKSLRNRRLIPSCWATISLTATSCGSSAFETGLLSCSKSRNKGCLSNPFSFIVHSRVVSDLPNETLEVRHVQRVPGEPLTSWLPETPACECSAKQTELLGWESVSPSCHCPRLTSQINIVSSIGRQFCILTDRQLVRGRACGGKSLFSLWRRQEKRQSNQWKKCKHFYVPCERKILVHFFPLHTKRKGYPYVYSTTIPAAIEWKNIRLKMETLLPLLLLKFIFTRN